LSPLDIHFTHNNIDEYFSNDQGGKGPHLLETLRACLKDEIPDKVDMIDVIWHAGKVYVAGTYNRRLCVWRLLTLLLPERFKLLKVRFVPERDKQKVFHFKSGETKLTTECEGDWIEIRWQRFVGKQLQPDPRWYSDGSGYRCRFDPGVQWPEALNFQKSRGPG